MVPASPPRACLYNPRGTYLSWQPCFNPFSPQPTRCRRHHLDIRHSKTRAMTIPMLCFTISQFSSLPGNFFLLLLLPVPKATCPGQVSSDNEMASPVRSPTMPYRVIGYVVRISNNSAGSLFPAGNSCGLGFRGPVIATSQKGWLKPATSPKQKEGSRCGTDAVADRWGECGGMRDHPVTQPNSQSLHSTSSVWCFLMAIGLGTLAVLPVA